MPKPKPTAATFEVFQMNTVFWWYVKDADGNVIDSHDRDFHYDDKYERMVGSRAFPTEAAACEWFAAEYPGAVDLHQTRDYDLPSELAVDKARTHEYPELDPTDLEAVRRAHINDDLAVIAKKGG